MRTTRAIALTLTLGLFSFAGGNAVKLTAAAASPNVSEATVATFVAGDITLTGERLGGSAVARSLRFDYEATSTTIDGASPLVREWTDARIRVSLPPAVHSGQITVSADGQSSVPVALLVFVYTSAPTPGSASDPAHPLALALAADGKVWINEEYHTKLKSLSTALPPIGASFTIPEYAPPGIFAQNLYGDTRSGTTALGEDITVAPDGGVWFTEGGAYLYAGANLNSSRIVRFDPAAATFACYNVPVDSAEVAGLLIDQTRGMIWYSESSLLRGNAISGFSISSAQSDCQWNPDGAVRAVLCSAQQVPGCHQRFVLPHPYSSPVHLSLDAQGNLWFSEFWANRLGRLNPDTGQIVELPLPAPIVRQGPGLYVGSGPWEVEADANGDLWVSENFDAQIMRVRPSLMASNDCTALDATGVNPCVQLTYSGSDGADGNTTHSLTVGADGRVWFGQSGVAARIGFVDTQHGNAVVLLPPLPVNVDIAGIRQDPVSGDVWFAEYAARVIGRMQLATGDGDGIPDAIDNCPTVYNPGQENQDANFVNLASYGKRFNDATWPNSDNLGDACDPDADNDGLLNADELALGPGGAAHALCPSASANTDPLKLDTDGDGYTDRAECLLGSDPANALSKPPSRYLTGDADSDGLPDAVEVQIGTDPNKADSDGDGVSDGVEVLRFGTNPLSTDTDHDGCSDGKEIASVNNDYAVTSLDMLIVAQAYGTFAGMPKYVPDFDMDRNGAINATDIGLAARQFGRCP